MTSYLQTQKTIIYFLKHFTYILYQFDKQHATKHLHLDFKLFMTRHGWTEVACLGSFNYQEIPNKYKKFEVYFPFV